MLSDDSNIVASKVQFFFPLSAPVSFEFVQRMQILQLLGLLFSILIGGVIVLLAYKAFMITGWLWKGFVLFYRLLRVIVLWGGIHCVIGCNLLGDWCVSYTTFTTELCIAFLATRFYVSVAFNKLIEKKNSQIRWLNFSLLIIIIFLTLGSFACSLEGNCNTLLINY